MEQLVVFGLDFPFHMLKRYEQHGRRVLASENQQLIDITKHPREDLARLIEVERQFSRALGHPEYDTKLFYPTLFIPRGISLRRLREIWSDVETLDYLKEEKVFSDYNIEFKEL